MMHVTRTYLWISCEAKLEAVEPVKPETGRKNAWNSTGGRGHGDLKSVCKVKRNTTEEMIINRKKYQKGEEKFEEKQQLHF